METKQTAMLKLINEIKEAVPYFKLDIYQANFNKALQEEKEQIINAHLDAYVEMNMSFRGADRAEQYYNETYNNLNN